MGWLASQGLRHKEENEDKQLNQQWSKKGKFVSEMNEEERELIDGGMKWKGIPQSINERHDEMNETPRRGAASHQQTKKFNFFDLFDWLVLRPAEWPGELIDE